MSKMMKALNKAKKLRDGDLSLRIQNNSGAVSAVGNDRDEPAFNFGPANVTAVLVLLAIVVLSTFVSFKTLAELKKAKDVAIALGQSVTGQEERFAKLKMLIANSNLELKNEVGILSTQVDVLKTALVKRDKEISDSIIEANVLKIRVNELSETNRELMEKVILVEDELNQVKKSKDRLTQKYIGLNNDLKQLKTLRQIEAVIGGSNN